MIKRATQAPDGRRKDLLNSNTDDCRNKKLGFEALKLCGALRLCEQPGHARDGASRDY